MVNHITHTIPDKPRPCVSDGDALQQSFGRVGELLRAGKLRHAQALIADQYYRRQQMPITPEFARKHNIPLLRDFEDNYVPIVPYDHREQYLMGPFSSSSESNELMAVTANDAADGCDMGDADGVGDAGDAGGGIGGGDDIGGSARRRPQIIIPVDPQNAVRTGC